MKNWIFKGVLPLLLIAFLLFFFKGAYVVDGKIDWHGRAEMFDSWNDINRKER